MESDSLQFVRQLAMKVAV
ncbi:hypothetical protein GQ600_24677 [Phytophthora cactorum]|nr:hypothetical protein GQ600_24677 [Phytophthora cactorum]